MPRFRRKPIPILSGFQYNVRLHPECVRAVCPACSPSQSSHVYLVLERKMLGSLQIGRFEEMKPRTLSLVPRSTFNLPWDKRVVRVRVGYIHGVVKIPSTRRFDQSIRINSSLIFTVSYK